MTANEHPQDTEQLVSKKQQQTVGLMISNHNRRDQNVHNYHKIFNVDTQSSLAIILKQHDGQ